jgi:hypothetical protein
MAYVDLKAAVTSWTAKSNLTAVLDDFVTLAEAKFNRRLRTNEMETSMSPTTIASDVIARPAGLIEFKAIWATGGEQRTLEQKTLEFIMKQPALSTTPKYYAWDGANIRFYPSSGSVAAVYYTKVTALSIGNNWLYVANPDLYLWGALEQAYLWLKDDVNEAKFRAITDSLIQELNERSIAAQISGGPLIARVR